MPRDLPQYETLEWFKFSKENRSAFELLNEDVFTADGLLSCHNLVVSHSGTSYDLWLKKNKQILVCPNVYSSSVTDYLLTNPALWKCAAIRVTHSQRSVGRAPMFGVAFRRAVQEAFRKGFEKSQFYLPNQQDDVFYASLLLHVNRRKESNGSIIELQAWQYCPGISEVFISMLNRQTSANTSRTSTVRLSIFPLTRFGICLIPPIKSKTTLTKSSFGLTEKSL